jgi:hypothetical protein
MVEATLLLLGIYEDTGSLTYSRTTSRDLRAAGFLLEQGANLGILNDFLNHPLSLRPSKPYTTSFELLPRRTSFTATPWLSPVERPKKWMKSFLPLRTSSATCWIQTRSSY